MGWARGRKVWETFLVVQRLRLHTHNAGGPGPIPGHGTRSHMPQLRPGNQINKFFFLKKEMKGPLT